MPSDDDAGDKCPVDHKSREAWLRAAESASALQPPNALQPSDTHPVSSSSSQTVPPGHPAVVPHRMLKTRPLATDREVSTIPRAPISPNTTTPNPSSPAATTSPSSSIPLASSSSTAAAAAVTASHGAPSNHEAESGSSATGHWIYPSERMFFDAMARKSYSPHASDMASIVPIHNAVNERAWHEIKLWEARFGWSRAQNRRCGGPKLASFSGDSSKLTPKAWMRTWMGYQAPFDRHDWVVERCPGEGVEYVIDFYQGRGAEGAGGAKSGLSFFLDVRPKLNTWEGCKMRMLSLLGW